MSLPTISQEDIQQTMKGLTKDDMNTVTKIADIMMKSIIENKINKSTIDKIYNIALDETTKVCNVKGGSSPKKINFSALMKARATSLRNSLPTSTEELVILNNSLARINEQLLPSICDRRLGGALQHAFNHLKEVEGRAIILFLITIAGEYAIYRTTSTLESAIHRMTQKNIVLSLLGIAAAILLSVRDLRTALQEPFRKRKALIFNEREQQRARREKILRNSKTQHAAEGKRNLGKKGRGGTRKLRK